MQIRRLFVPLNGYVQDRYALPAAARLADDFKAHLDAVLMKPDPSKIVPPFGLGQIADEFRASIAKSTASTWEAVEESVRAQFSASLMKENLREVSEPQGPGIATARLSVLELFDPVEAGLRYAKASDMTICGMPSDQESSAIDRYSDRLLLQSGRPCLFVPETGLPVEFDRIGIAWDGGNEAASSVAGAMPFIELASSVDVVTVKTDASGNAFPEDIGEYLAWHGCATEVHEIGASFEPVGQRIAEFSTERNWDLIVMGAYDSHRLLQVLFSGPTRDVLMNANIPVLQAH